MLLESTLLEAQIGKGACMPPTLLQVLMAASQSYLYLILQVLGNKVVCEQLHEWLASWKRSACTAVPAQSAEEQQNPGSELSPEMWRRNDSQDGNWSEVTLAAQP